MPDYTHFSIFSQIILKYNYLVFPIITIEYVSSFFCASSMTCTTLLCFGSAKALCTMILDWR